MSLPEIFLTSVDSNTNITDEIPLIIACRDNELEGDYHINPIIFIECNPDIYMNSLTCRKMAKIMTKDEILNAYDGKNMLNVEIIKKLQIVIYMHEQKEYFTIEHINYAGEFYQYIKFADKYMLNIELICSKMENIIWLIMIKERQRDLWRANSILLKNIEQKIFNNHKFGAVIQQQPAAYPVGNVAKSVPKYITMSEVRQNKFMDNELLVDLINVLLRSRAFDFVSKLIAVLGSSIEYCDKIYTSPEIIKQVYNLPVFIPSMYYALRIMYLEELSMLNRKRGPGRFIIDISAASALPFVSTEYFNSPYFVTTVEANYKNNLTLPANYNESRGIYTMDEFNHRLSIFTKDAIKNIKWSSNNYQTALSGSIITACAIKTPFEGKFHSIENYFNEYYPCRTEGKICDNSQNKQNTLYTECSDSDSESSSSDDETEEIESIKTEKKIDYSDIDLMIACEWELFDKIANQHYMSIRSVVNCEIKMEKVITENKHKYIIRGLHRDIDIFHVNDIPSVIVKYHLGCVRAWYDGTTVSCFPSFISAAFTGINIDLRWVSNKKDVRDVVLKYFQRGFGTLINSNDRKNLITYVNQSDHWPSIKIGAVLSQWGNRNYNNLPLFHDNHSKMFNPSFSKTGIHKHLNTIPTNLHILRKDEFTDNNVIINDYRDLNAEKIITPNECKSLAHYL